MINTIEALQGLYVALGGDLADVANITTIPGMLLAISEVAAAAASELPAVKSADNGKVLTVVSGKWDKAEPQTSEMFVVNIHENEQRQFSSNRTFAEITNALTANKQVVMNFTSVYQYPTFENCNYVPLSLADSTRYTFSVFRIGDGDVRFAEFFIRSNDTVSCSSLDL